MDQDRHVGALCRSAQPTADCGSRPLIFVQLTSLTEAAWILHGDGSYERLTPGEQEPVYAREAFLEEYAYASQD